MFSGGAIPRSETPGFEAGARHTGGISVRKMREQSVHAPATLHSDRCNEIACDSIFAPNKSESRSVPVPIENLAEMRFVAGKDGEVGGLVEVGESVAGAESDGVVRILVQAMCGRGHFTAVAISGYCSLIATAAFAGR